MKSDKRGRSPDTDPWFTGLAPREAMELQRSRAQRVVASDGFDVVRTVAGADVAILPDGRLVAGIKVFEYPSLVGVDEAWAVVETSFPYIPGLLSFREGPAILQAFSRLGTRPDVLILDGHGIAHPRGFGIACHIGLALDIPSFGIGKKPLFGERTDPGATKGSTGTIVHPGTQDVIGTVLRTRDRIKPVFVSVGHRISLGTAVAMALECSRGYRIPEPTRLADRFVADVKRSVIEREARGGPTTAGG